jgi:hypothetical protein
MPHLIDATNLVAYVAIDSGLLWQRFEVCTYVPSFKMFDLRILFCPGKCCPWARQLQQVRNPASRSVETRILKVLRSVSFDLVKVEMKTKIGKRQMVEFHLSKLPYHSITYILTN